MWHKPLSWPQVCLRKPPEAAKYPVKMNSGQYELHGEHVKSR